MYADPQVNVKGKHLDLRVAEGRLLSRNYHLCQKKLLFARKKCSEIISKWIWISGYRYITSWWFSTHLQNSVKLDHLAR